MHRTPMAKGRPSAPVATPSPAAAAASGDKKVGLSSKILGMKFMQRSAESQLRKTLEAEKTQVQQAHQWTATPPPAAASVAAGSAGAATPVAPASHAAFAASPFSPHFGTGSAVGAAFSALAPRGPSVFIDEQDTSATPALPASALSGSPSPSATGAAGDAAPLPKFVPGRRSYGAFNPRVDALVAEAKQLTETSVDQAKAARREVRNSVSDEGLADHYVGLRGKAANKQQISGGGAAAHRKGHKHPRNDAGGEQGAKKHKPAGSFKKPAQH